MGNGRKNASNGISVLRKWLDDNFLTLNLLKSHFITFIPTERTLSDINEITVYNYVCTISADNCSRQFVIKKVGKIKYLGVVIDSDLKWNEHVNIY